METDGAPAKSDSDNDLSPINREEVKQKLTKKLTKNFADIDVDQSGTVTVDEMW